MRSAHTERSMLDRLNVRYSSRVTNGGWSGSKYLRAEHVPAGLRLQRHRICDFVATSMHSTPWAREQPMAFPPVFHGHEVKVSRSDWLAELRDLLVTALTTKTKGRVISCGIVPTIGLAIGVIGWSGAEPADLTGDDAGAAQSDLTGLINELTQQMHAAAEDLQFELAARLRDEIRDLKKELRDMRAAS